MLSAWQISHTNALLCAGQTLPYPPGIIGWEITCVCLYFLIDSARTLLGSRGNKTEQPGPVIFFILLAVPCIIGNVYYFTLQLYVLRIDKILNLIPIIFLSLETPIAVLALLGQP